MRWVHDKKWQWRREGSICGSYRFGGNLAPSVMSSEAKHSRDIWPRIWRVVHSRPDFSAPAFGLGRNDNGTAFGLSPSRTCVALRRAGRSLVSPVMASEAISRPRNGDGFIAALLARTQASPADGAPGLPQSYRAPPTHTAGNFRIDSESLILNNQGLMSRPKWRNWQTRRIQNPVRFTPGEGSIPSFGTLPRHAG